MIITAKRKTPWLAEHADKISNDEHTRQDLFRIVFNYVSSLGTFRFTMDSSPHTTWKMLSKIINHYHHAVSIYI